MKTRKPLLKSLLAKFRKAEVVEVSAPAPRPLVRKNSARKTISSIEGLEGRIAPATLVNPSTVLFTDFDGDIVTVKFSKNVLTDLTKANAVLKFSTGANAVVAGTTPTTALENLWLMDLTALGSVANGLSVSITATGSGNGSVDVGAIKATGLSLSTIAVEGDLGQIDVGRAGAPTALAALKVGSIGVRGLASQDPGSTPSLVSTISGALGSLSVTGDVKEARINVINGSAANNITPIGNIGSIVINGSLIGLSAVEAASNNTGRIDATGAIGSIRIGTDLSEGIVGGGGENAGQILAGGKIGTVSISGSLTGGGGSFSGTVLSSGSSISAVKIGGDIAGGAGLNSGRVQASTTLASIAIGDDMVAGTGENSGGISASLLGAVSVNDIDGRTTNAGARSGGIAGGKLNSLSVTGSILGGTAGQTGAVEITGDIGAVVVRGSVTGGDGQSSGAIVAYGKLGAAIVFGNLTGGNGLESGEIVSGYDDLRLGDMGTVKVLGRVEGGQGDKSGSIRSGGKISGVFIGTAAPVKVDVLKGGAGDYSGFVESQGLISSLVVNGNVAGGTGDFSGSIRSVDRVATTGEFAGAIGAVSITGQLRGGDGLSSGGIFADGNLSSLVVGSWTGGSGNGSGSVRTGEGFIQAGNTGSIRILGTFLANGTPGTGSASILVGGNLTALAIAGLTDGATVRVGDALGALSIRADVSDTLVTARGQLVQGATTDLAIGSISIVGSVTNSSFLAGYRLDGDAVNPDAQIGAVAVTGAWTASNLVAGVVDTDSDGFGDADDALISSASNKASIVARIASVVINGAVSGTGAGGPDHFGFTAQQVVKMKLGTVTVPLTAVTLQVFEQDTPSISGRLGSTGNDVSIREVA